MAHQHGSFKYDSGTDDEIDDGFVVLDDSLTVPWSDDQTNYRSPPQSLVEKGMQYMKDGVKGEALESLKEALVACVGSSLQRAAFEEALRTLSMKGKIRGLVVDGTVTTNAIWRYVVQEAVLRDNSDSRPGPSNDACEDVDSTTAFLSRATNTWPSSVSPHSLLRSLPTLDATKLLDGVTRLFGPRLDTIEAQSLTRSAENEAGSDPLSVPVEGLRVTDDGDDFDPLGVSTVFQRGPKTEAEQNRRQTMLDKWSKMEERNLERDRGRRLRPRPLVSPDTMLKDL